MPKPRKRIGDILIESGVITPAQLQEALTRQRKTRERLGRVLVEMKVATERQIAQALADQLGLRLLNVATMRVDPAAVKLVPEVLARKRRIIPVALDGESLVVAVADPLDVYALDDVGIAARRTIAPMVAEESEIAAAIERIYGMGAAAQAVLDDFDEQDQSAPAEDGEDTPAVRLVNMLLAQALKDRASDIHIEPGEADVRVRLRIDGVLYTVMNVPKSVHSALVSRVKVLSQMNIAERRLPQDGAFETQLDGKALDIRVATAPTIFGERVALRLLDKARGLLTLEQVGMYGDVRRRYESSIKQPYGIVLVSGPTGSGKTTTLISSLALLNSADCNIITVEDPVEYQLPGVSHIQVNPRSGLTFASGLRSILRHDPDIIMIGEIRDRETAEIAIQASLTGHLVLTTIHTNDAPGALTRLADMGVEPYLVASGVLSVVSQRLVRLLCPHCKQPDQPVPEVLAWLTSLVPEPLPSPQFHRAAGCPQCRHSGYIGRTGIFEVLPITEGIRWHILARSSAAHIAEAARAEGMTDMRADGMLKAMRGLTTVEEVLRITRSESTTPEAA